MSTISLPAGRMITLAGQELPAVYTDVTAEYAALSENCGLLDMGHSEWIRLTGPDVRGFLQGLITQDVHSISRNSGAPSWALDANGKIVTLFHLYFAEGYLIETPSGMADRLHAHLERYLIMEDVTLTREPELTCLSLQGPQALYEKERLRGIMPELQWLSRDRSGFGGFDPRLPSR